MNTRVWSVRLSVFAVVAAFLGLTLLPTDAEARRMGGGGSFGRSAPSQFQKSPPSTPAVAPQRSGNQQQATNNPSAAGTSAAAAPRNRFLGPLGGLAAGLGLAALFGFMGFGAGMAEFLGTMLMIGLAVFAVMFLVRTLRGQSARQRPAYQAPGAGGQGAAQNTYRQAQQPAPSAPQQPVFGNKPDFEPVPGMEGFGAPRSAASEAVEVNQGPVKNLPAGFDEQGFVQNAKKFFVTMQGAYDKGDLDALREYCSDDVVEHLRGEIQSRNGVENRTDVVTLNAELLGFETDVDEQIATVAFSGMVREEKDAAASELNELWILSRPVSGGGWVLVGIHNL